MLIGHFASGTGMYSFLKENRVTLFIIVLGTQFLDVLWGLFVFLGIEGGISGGEVSQNLFDVPWSHSLLMAVVWSVVYAGIAWQIAIRNNYDTVLFPKMAAFAVFSHWILDMLVHGKDMLLTPFSTTSLPTLHLWATPLLAFIAELLILLISWYLYYNKISTRDHSRWSWIVFGIYLLLLGYTYLPSIIGGTAMEVQPVFGLITIALITILAVLPSVLYPPIESA